MRDPYVYPGTNVLINNKNIKIQSELDQIETLLTVKALATGLPAGKFDFEHFKNIHKHIFGELYPWAGKTREVNIAKPSGMFCASHLVENEINKLLNQLSKEEHLKIFKEPNEFIPKFTHYFAEVNAIHPFREGNGRTTRQFFEQLAHYNGYQLDLSSISRDEYLEACISSHNLDNSKLEKVFTKSLSPLIELEKVQKIFTELNKILDKQFFKLSKEYIGVDWKVGNVMIFPTKTEAEKARTPNFDIIHANHTDVLKYAQNKANDLNITFERVKSKTIGKDFTLDNY